jgi:hypothetical protein
MGRWAALTCSLDHSLRSISTWHLSLLPPYRAFAGSIIDRIPEAVTQ